MINMLHKLNIVFDINIIIVFIFFTNISFSQTIHQLDKDQRINIPVSFHIVENNKGKTKLEIEKTHKKIIDRINLIINKINEGFNNVNKDKIEVEYQNDIANSNIYFYLNTTNGITFHATSKKGFDKTNNYDKSLKQFGYVNSKKNLNIWVCEINRIFTIYGWLESQGYSTYPTEKNPLNDGVVISIQSLLTSDYYFMISNPIHEIGHWLGLEHIWGNENNCNSDDGISDTPQQKGPHKYKEEPYTIDDIQDVCFPLLTKHIKANYQNFMDYSNVYGMFTKGQAIEMRNNIFKYRKGFLSNTTNLAVYQNMTAENFNYYVLSTNNLKYQSNEIYLKKFIKQIQKLNPKSEFDLKRMKVNAIKKIENSIINLNTKYKKSNYVDFLRKYNFENKYFPFKVNIVLWDWQGSYQLKYFSELDKYQNFSLYAINSDDFDKIELSDKKAEKLINLTNQRRIYPQIEYSTLKIPVKNSKGKLVGMLAHIDHIKIFSDIHRTRLVHTIYAKTNKETYHKYSYAIWNDIVNKFQLY